ncbi:hypothetical protein [Paludibacterium purpuratum]|uniref:Uncharacterized protein n=1 Tax=Paludibacterium purpuratum TaxID=1144873 RepID=A0A4R7B5P6_9NEIS|nr:hypothetical protein [Paludibacterium purpuratum]TDR80000.1 hypothetical protein DFP86_106140 [Paludibacterium purpuratum]
MANETTLSVALALSLDNGIKVGLAAVIQQVKEADKASDSFAARLEKINQITQQINQIASGGMKLYQLYQGGGEAMDSGFGKALARAKTGGKGKAAAGGKDGGAGPGGGFDFMAAAKQAGEVYKSAKPLIDQLSGGKSGGKKGGFDFLAAAKQAGEVYKSAKPLVDQLAGGKSGDKKDGFDFIAAAKQAGEIYKSAKPLVDQLAGGKADSSTAGRSGARSRRRAQSGTSDRSAGGAGFDPFAVAKSVADFYLAKTGAKGKGKGKGGDKLEGPVATLVKVNQLVQAIPKLTGKPLPANLGPLMDGITKAAVNISKDPAMLSALSQTFGALSKVFTASGLPAKFQALGSGLTQMRGIIDSGIGPAIGRGVSALGQAGNAFKTIGGLISGPIGSALNFGVKLVALFGETLSTLGMTLMANPVVLGITLVIALVVGALWYFRNSLGGVGDAIQAAWEKLKKMVSFFGGGGDDTSGKKAATAVPTAPKMPPAPMVPPVPPRGRAAQSGPANLYITHEGKTVLAATVTAAQAKAANRPASGGRQADPTRATRRPGAANYGYGGG